MSFGLFKTGKLRAETTSKFCERGKKRENTTIAIFRFGISQRDVIFKENNGFVNYAVQIDVSSITLGNMLLHRLTISLVHGVYPVAPT